MTELRDFLSGKDRHLVADLLELLDLDRLAGIVQKGLGVGALFVPGLAAGAAFFLADAVVGAAGKAYDASAAGQDGALARIAGAVAALSAQVPAVVIIDDADRLDHDLAVVLIENLTGRHGSKMLVVAVVDPDSPQPGADPGGSLRATLTARARFGLTSGLVQVAEADPDMGYESRLELARGLCPHLPDAAVRRIAQRTASFGDVFTVTAARGLAGLSPGEDADVARGVVDAAVNLRLARPAPSSEAMVIAWAGLVHARQADQALEILGATRQGNDPDARRWGSLERLADPAQPRLGDRDQVTAGLAPADRRAMAEAFLSEALTLAADRNAGMADQTAALLAAHRVRRDLADRGKLPRAQRDLAACLEALGDPPTALDVAATALDEWPSDVGSADDKDALAAMVLRLSGSTPQPAYGPLAEQLIAEAIDGGAVLGLEARVWAAADLLNKPGQREGALSLVGEVTADLDAHPNLGESGDRWRLLLAARSARAGHPAMAGHLLAPLLASEDQARHRPARAILDAGDGPRADIRLQNILLEDELAALPGGADDDRLRIHRALAANHATIGNYHHALAHGQHELTLRTHIQGSHHPDTLTSRADIAEWTGQCGDVAGALILSRELLPDRELVLGSDHPDTLATRANIAGWTGRCGDAAGALALCRDLLPDLERVQGPDHPDTLAARNNIAHWTGSCGDAAGALALFRGLLPDQERVLGPDHPDTLTTRANIAAWTGECGDAAGALALCRDLLSDQELVLGLDHPGALLARSSIAYWTGRCGDAARALALFRELLPDLERVQGPDHPDTLAVRSNIASWTRECGDVVGALALFRELLPDLEQVVGLDHPDTLGTRKLIAAWTGECGDAAGRWPKFRELMPDMERVLGPDHPDTFAARSDIAAGPVVGMRPGRWPCSGGCCPTWSWSWAPITHADHPG